MRCPPFIMGGGHYAYSFVTKRVAEKSRYFRGARLAAHNERRHPAKRARSCASKPHWGFDCFATAQSRPRGLRGCEQGATVERSETGERAMFAPAGRITARAGLRSKLAAIVLAAKRSPLRTPKLWSSSKKAKKCRSAAFFLTLFRSSPD